MSRTRVPPNRRFRLLVSLGVIVACAAAIAMLGWSPNDEAPVWREILERLPATTELVFLALVAALALGALLGFMRAAPRAPALRQLLALPPLIFRSIPIVALAFTLQLAFMFSRSLPVAGDSSLDSFDVRDRLAHLAGPVLMLALPFGAWSSQIFYDFFAQPNGAARVSPRCLVAPVPIAAASIGPALLSASIVVELIDGWPGIGRLFYSGLRPADPALLAGSLLVYVALIVLLELGAWLLPAVQDATPPATEASRSGIVSRRWPRVSATGIIAIVLLIAAALAAVAANALAPFNPNFIDQVHWLGYPLAPGAGGHPLGTDENGRDLLARLLFGLRMSLGIAVLAAVVAAAIAALVARAAPWFGDRRALGVAGIRAFAALPFVQAAILVLIRRFHEPHVLSPVGIALIVSAVSWPAVVPAFRRLTRATLAAVVAVTGGALLLEFTLSMLGWGVQPPAASLGNMLANMQSNLTAAPWAVFIPIGVATVVLAALHALADDLRETSAS